MAKKNFNYIIADGKRNAMILCGVKLFGIKVDLVALFAEEEQALEVLYRVMKENPDLPPHQVFRIEAGITFTEVTNGGAA